MITSFSIQHFKCFNSIELPFRNLNVLTGKNGMGKSSVIQALLLLRQSNGWQELILNGQYLNIAPAKKILYESTPKDDEVIRIGLEEVVSEETGSEVLYNEQYEVSYSPSATSMPIQRILGIGENKSLTVNSQKRLSFFSQTLYYIAASRISPKSSYPNGGSQITQTKNVGESGQYTAQLLSEYGRRVVKNPKLYHGYYNSTAQEESILLTEASKWLSEMTSEVRVRVTDHSNEFQLQYEYATQYGYTTPFDPIHVGFGLTYCLPIIVACLLAEPGSMIIVENPEAHLHPKGQSKLGELLARTAQNGVQCLIETHSDHIINGIRIAVMQEMLESENVKIFFFDRNSNQGQQETIAHVIDIFPDGRLSAEYVDFFDQIERDYDTLLGI